MYQYAATLDRVVDGDTVDFDIDLGFDIHVMQRVRLLGVDTPERGQEGFDEATVALEEKLIKADRIEVWTSKTGKYGRYLGDIYTTSTGENGEIRTTHINPWIIQMGYGVKYE